VALRYACARTSSEMWTAKDGAEFANGEMRPTYDWLLHGANVKTVRK